MSTPCTRIEEALFASQALAAAMAFGVPVEAMHECRKLIAGDIHAWLREQANDPDVVEAVARAGLSEEAWRVWGESMRDDSREDAHNALGAFLEALGGGA